MKEAIARADVVITATGEPDIVRKEHYEVARDGVILANAGHFDVEINKPDLENMAVERREVRPYVMEYVLSDGRRVYLLCDGRLVNLCAAEGHPADVMDLSFANQALAALYIKENHKRLKPAVYTLPEAIEIDEPSEAQLRRTWVEGT